MAKSSSSTLRKETSPSKKVLVGIRVSPTFHRRIQTECVRRDLSVQDLVMQALRFYFESPSEGNEVEIGVLDNVPGLVPAEVDEQLPEQDAWSDLWDKYTRRMPREKIEVMTHAMEWDLQMQRSSRRKRTRRTYRRSARLES